MSWLSKKILVGVNSFLYQKLRNYFYIQDEKNIQVSLLTKQEVKCSNLLLKVETINKPSMLLHIKYCNIGSLEVSFNGKKSGAKKPLSLIMDRVKVIVKFNPQVEKKQEQTTATGKQKRPVVEQFIKAVSTEDQYKQRTFIQEEIYQLTKLITQYALEQLYVKIQNIDVAIQYQQKPKFFGIEIEEIEAKQEFTAQQTTNYSNKAPPSTSQFQCDIKNMSAYFGAQYEIQNLLNGFQSRKISKMKKKYILNKFCLCAAFHMQKNMLSINSKNMTFDLQDIFIYQLLNLINFSSSQFSDKPRLRPGQGQLVQIKKITSQSLQLNANNQKRIVMYNGTLQWWQLLGSKVMQKLNKQVNTNILRSVRFRKYLFCILYRYTFGAHHELEKMIDEYEVFKTDMQIMIDNKIILQKIYSIRTYHPAKDEDEFFLSFICSIQDTNPQINKLRLKKVTLKQVKNSNIIVNYENCVKFINVKQMQQANAISINLQVNHFYFRLSRPRIFTHIKNDLQSEPPELFLRKKNIYLQYYCNKSIMMSSSQNIKMEQTKENKNNKNAKQQREHQIKPFVQLQINSLKLDFNSGTGLHLAIPQMEIYDRQTQTKICSISRLVVVNQNMRPEAYQWKIVADKRMQLDIQMIFIQANSKFVQQMLTALSYIKQPQTQEKAQNMNFITQFISKKVPSSPIFNTYQSTSLDIFIKSIIISAPVFHKGRNFQLNLKGISYNDPINGKSMFGIEQVFIMRTNMQNTRKKISGESLRNDKNLDENVILTSIRPFNGYLDKRPQQNITDILIPFILIQISCQDVYYGLNISNIWNKIMSNPYYFPKKKIRQKKRSEINPNSVKFAWKMQKKMRGDPQQQKQKKKQKIQKQIIKRLNFKIQGIQLNFISDYLNEENNRIMDLLIDSVIVSTSSNYTTDFINFQLRDVYIRNCLSFKGINKESLITSIKDELKFGDQPILYDKNQKQLSSQQKNAKMQRNRQLLLFTDAYNIQHQKKPFLQLTIQSTVTLQQYKSTTYTNLTIVPIYIFYSVQFTDMTLIIMSTLAGLSSENILSYQSNFRKQHVGIPFSSFQAPQGGTTTTDIIDIKEAVEEPQIMAASQFQQITIITGNIKKLNFLAVKNSSVVYTISLFDIKFRHRSEPYLKRYFFNANRLIIVDTSEQAGPQPIIIDLSKEQKGSSPLKGSFTSFNSQIMKYRQKKSAFFHLQLNGPQIMFLKKKVLELVNFLLIVLTQTGILSPPDQQNKNPPKPNPYPLRYKIEILETKLKLFRSSLSKQGFKSIIKSIKISNYPEQAQTPDTMPHSNKIKTSEQLSITINQDNNRVQQRFEQFENNKEQDIMFTSFEKQGDNKKNPTIQKIYIQLYGFFIFSHQYWNKEYTELFQFVKLEQVHTQCFLHLDEIFIQFFAPEMVVKIPMLFGNMLDEDFRILMRMTQQNLSESPLLFVMSPNIQTATKLSFRTSFQIDHTEFSIRTEQKNLSNPAQTYKNKITLQLDSLSGKNELWTNNENITQLSIYEMHLLTNDNITIMSRLDQQHFKQMPSIPKDIIDVDLYDYGEFRKMEKKCRELLYQLLENQTDKVEVFKEESRDQFDGGDKVKERTNSEKIYEWMKGMIKKCNKCCCKCCRKNTQQDSNNELLYNIFKINKNNNTLLSNDSRIKIDKNNLKNPKAPMIYKFEDILDFQYSIDSKTVEVKKKQPNMVYLNFAIKPNGEKIMYMQVKKVQVLLENSKGLIGMSTFFARPFSISDIPEHVRQYKFNNPKPFKMLIQFDDALAEIKAQNQQGKVERVSVLCDLRYDNEKKGDTVIGPGLSVMKIESVAKILFMSDNFSDPIDLSDSFKAIYVSENRIPYGEKNRNENKQRVFLQALEKQDHNISFFIPAFALKSLNRIFLYNFTKVQTQDQIQAKNQKYFRQKHERQKAMSVIPQQNKVKKTLSLFSRHDEIEGEDQEKKGQVGKKSSMGLNVSIPAQENIQKYKKQQMNKPLAIPQNPKQSHMIRSIFIPEITFEIESNLQISFIKSKISNIMLSELYINNKAYKRNTRNLLAKLDVNYWNLKLGVYEPCIQPWSFRMQQDIYQRDNLSSSNVKVSSQIDNWKAVDEYVNDLNINISLALYQIYKELMVVYEQQDYDQNQNCIDLTQINTSDYKTLFSRRNNRQFKQQQKKQKLNFPSKLLKYFTRQFKPDQSQNLQSYISLNKKYFNPPNLRLYVYHSYFDHFRRKKCITYRTPYRIFNSTNVDLALYFFNPKVNMKATSKLDRTKEIISRWKVVVKRFEHYAIPDQIYQTDFLVHVSDDLSMDKPQPGSPYVSVKYLIQMRGNKNSFKTVNAQSIIWKNIFKYSSAQTQKLIDQRDMILRVGKYNFTSINVYSKHERKQQQQTQKYNEQLKFYDAYCIIQSPIIIDNYTYMDIKLKVNNQKQLKIPQNQRLQINEHFNQIVSDTAVEFLNDSLHEERKLFWEKSGIQRIVEIQKLQSIKINISRDTCNSCYVKIYSQWNVYNLTNQNFSIKNSQKIVLIDKLSFNCLSNISSKGIDICIVNEQKHTKKIKPNNIADVITLAKRKRPKTKQEQDRYHKVLESKRMYEKQKCCGGLRPQSTKLYEFIDFVINAKEDPIEPVLCQKIQFRYRYLIRNKTIHTIRLCQQHKQFVIADLPPLRLNQTRDPKYIFYYDFLPQNYFIQIDMEMTEILDSLTNNLLNENMGPQEAVSPLRGSLKKQRLLTLTSCEFKLDQFPGSTFVIKIKKQGQNIENEKYENRFYYFRFEIKKVEQQTLIQITNVNLTDNNFPIYLQNLTPHNIQIQESTDILTLKPKQTIPFTWSTLNSQQFILHASIQGYGQETQQKYQFNNKSSFQPIKIVDKTMKKKPKNVENLYLKEYCHVVYDYYNVSTVCLVVLDRFDNRLRIHSREMSFNYQVNMAEVVKISPLASKIEIYLEDGGKLELMPPSKSIKQWIDKLQQCINVNVLDKVFFTIESYGNSRIFFFKTMDQQSCESSKQQFSITHLNLSIISPIPQQIILLYCGNISYTQQDKLTKINYKNLQLNESQKIITIKKIKVSNQTRDAINPVVLSQIKKSNYPFIELRLIQEKLQLEDKIKAMLSHEEQLEEKEKEEMITHYKEVTFFMDQAEVMVEAALFLKMFGLKKDFDYVTNQYAVGQKLQKTDQSQAINISQGYRAVPLVNIQQNQQESKKGSQQVYINYLQIKPIKMTISVYLQHNESQQIQVNLINILRYIPFGIENAIIQMESYQYFHVFYNMNELKKQFIKYYKKQAWNQIYKNAGSYDMFVPIQLVGGVGNGVKQIFYDPIYELVRKKEIKAVGKTFCEGVLSFLLFLITFLFKLVNLIFKVLASLTFDREFRTKRQAFRKQIFKSPIEGAMLGWKNIWSVFKSFFLNFKNISKNYSGFFIFGYILGFILCIINIIPWTIKLVVCFYDWIYVIGLGFVNWGYYQESAMKARSRPRRTFDHTQIIPYNYLQALGHEIIRKNQLEQIQNEQIAYVKTIQPSEDNNNYLILSNYRIIHNYNRLIGMQTIKLYQLEHVQSWFLQNKNQYIMSIDLLMPNTHKILFLFSYEVSRYRLHFYSLTNISTFLFRLKKLCMRQKIAVKFDQGSEIKKQINQHELLLEQIMENVVDEVKRQEQEQVNKERNRWQKPDQPPKWGLRPPTTAIRQGD